MQNFSSANSWYRYVNGHSSLLYSYRNIFISFLVVCRGEKKKEKAPPHNLTPLYNFMRLRLFAEFRSWIFYKNCAMPYPGAFCRDNRYPSSKYRCSCTHRLLLFLFSSSDWEEKGARTEENSSGRSRGGRLTTCHTLRAWHAGLIIPWQRVSIRRGSFSFHENEWRCPRERIKKPHRCAGLDRSFLSSYRIHLDSGSLKLSIYLSFWSPT